jgi:hypothetical protein
MDKLSRKTWSFLLLKKWFWQNIVPDLILLAAISDAEMALPFHPTSPDC